MLRETYSSIYTKRISNYNVLVDSTHKVLSLYKCPKAIEIIIDGCIWAYLNNVILTSALTVDEVNLLGNWLLESKPSGLFKALIDKFASELGIYWEDNEKDPKIKVHFVNWDDETFWKNLFKK